MARRPSATMSPTKCSLIEARNRGWKVYPTESWKPVGQGQFFRNDLLGFIDHIAFDANITWAIQSTSKGNRSARVKKIMESEAALYWLCCDDHRIVVWDWGEYKRPVNGMRWRLHETRIGLVEIEEYRDHRDNVNRI